MTDTGAALAIAYLATFPILLAVMLGLTVEYGVTGATWLMVLILLVREVTHD